ncbi:MAG: type II toxin-antitoxin system RelB/DinJ family antitoxin [Anaerolineae bacterium]|nr:type II toxin-antitoxin system RelB/DinJ family antitoxin [Anaerolineae bacterium]
MSSVSIHTRMSPDVKHEFEQVLAQVGLTGSDAIRIFINRVIIERGIPFEMRVPNTATIQAIADARANRNQKIVNSASDLLLELDEADE